MVMSKNVKIIVTVVVLGTLLSFCVFCLWIINTKDFHREKKTAHPTDIKANDSANEAAAVRAVQNYQLPNGNTILRELELTLSRLVLSGNRVEAQGWYAGQWDSKYNVGFSAKVNGEERKWRFFYCPDKGTVEPANSDAERLW
jgi:hypothetical protein